MSGVEVRVANVYPDIQEAIRRNESLLSQVESRVLAHHKKWWKRWLYWGMTDEEIVRGSIRSLFFRCDIKDNIDALKMLQKMCDDAMISTGTITLSRKDYGLIYGTGL